MDPCQIREVVQSHYCYELLKFRQLTPKVLLKWLLTEPCTEDTLLAYRCLYLLAEPDDHYIDNTHFTMLSNDIEYLLIFIVSGGYESTPCYKSSKPDLSLSTTTSHNINSATIAQQRASELAVVYRSQQRFTRIRALCGLVPSEKYKHLQLATRLPQCSANRDDIKLYFDSHWYDMLDKTLTPNDYDLFIQETRRISNSFKWLWSEYLYKIYEQLAYTLYAEHLPHTITKRHVDELAELFPNLIPHDILQLSREAFDIYQEIDPIKQGYLLGFPIHYHIPSKKQIYQALHSLSMMGVDQYCNTKRGEWSNNTKEHSLYNIHNDEDVCYEKIDNYLPFDVVEYIEGDQIYRFSRREFETLITGKINTWRNCELPDTILLEIKKRSIISKYHSLPDAQRWEMLICKNYKIDSTNELMNSFTSISDSPHSFEHSALLTIGKALSKVGGRL